MSQSQARLQKREAMKREKMTFTQRVLESIRTHKPVQPVIFAFKDEKPYRENA